MCIFGATIKWGIVFLTDLVFIGQHITYSYLLVSIYFVINFVKLN